MIEGLKDIKPNLEILDDSWIILLVIFLFLILVGVVLFLLFKKKKRKRLTLKERKLKELKELDFNDDKNVAYKFSTDAYLFLNEQNKDIYQKIEQKLAPYKYKKQIPAMPKELKDEIKEFIRKLS